MAAHSLALELPIDQDLLNRILTRVATSASEPTVSISFDISDKEALRQHVLRTAVANARTNAEVLADAASLSLGEIVRIEYGALEVRFRSRPIMYEMTETAAEAPAPDITPFSMDAEDSVTVVWAID